MIISTPGHFRAILVCTSLHLGSLVIHQILTSFDLLFKSWWSDQLSWNIGADQMYAILEWRSPSSLTSCSCSGHPIKRRWLDQLLEIFQVIQWECCWSWGSHQPTKFQLPTAICSKVEYCIGPLTCFRPTHYVPHQDGSYTSPPSFNFLWPSVWKWVVR